MISNYLLLQQDYTLYNAITWRNCVGHYHRAYTPALSYSQRFFHATIALVELLPIVGQIISLFEMAIAYLFGPSTVLADLAKKPIQHIKIKEDPFPHQFRKTLAFVPLPNQLSITLPDRLAEPEKSVDWGELFFPLYRQIESQYRDLPWPEQIQNIVVFTEIRGGRGDIAAAAKAIAIMQKLHPKLTFDWVLWATTHSKQYDPRSFLSCDDPSKVDIRWHSSPPVDRRNGDLLLTGPVVNVTWRAKDILEQGIAHRGISGPIFGFMEIGHRLPISIENLAEKIINAPLNAPVDAIYKTLHSSIFPSKSETIRGLLPMGLLLGSGVLLDKSRIEARLSRGYCCASYLLQIKDAQLRKDILEAMNIFNSQSSPDYEQHSFNSGYAHHPHSWGKFIDCVAMHEKNKHVTIVLNQAGEFEQLSTRHFQDRVLTPQRLAFLKEKGYGTVLFKGDGSETALLQEAQDPQRQRRLTLIVRPHFTPKDMRCMQLASERLLATGDNSAIESWCARCKLYLYEDVANGNHKWRFLEQQVSLAKKISPHLSSLLALFGRHSAFSKSELDQVQQLLNHPGLSDATLQFCDQITSNYSFDKVFEGALKRTIWHHYMPQLAEIEAQVLGESFRSDLVGYLKNPQAREKSLHLTSLSQLGPQVRQAIEEQAPVY